MKDTTVQNNALHRAQDYGLSRRNLLLATTSLAAASAVPAAATAQTQKKPAARQNRIIINLSASWKFATDSGNIGQSQGWFSDSFDDSAWQTLLSGKSWESQNINYSGYAWYRRIVSLPGTVAGMPLKITLGSIYSDDDFYFNGVRIGGLKGEYKYSNLIARQYTIPASLVRAGAANTLAIRIWGGSISGQLKKSGLVSGTYSIVADNICLHGRTVSGSDNSEVPIEIFDLSGAQQGSAWELVVRVDPADITMPSPQISYSINDFYGVAITSGTSPVILGSDGNYKGVVSIDAVTSNAIYLAGRFIAQFNGTAWVDAGNTVGCSAGGFTEEVYSLAFQAGTVSLPPLNVGTAVGMYTVIIPDTSVVISNLVVNDRANASSWSIQSNLQVGNAIYGDRSFTVSSLSAYAGAQWIRTANNSRTYAGDPIASFAIDRPTTIYIGVDRRARKLPWARSMTADHLTFSARDTTALPSLPVQYDNTPYGNLKLIDIIDCSTDILSEPHGYMQSAFGQHSQDNKTPGAKVSVLVNPILGKNARETQWGWFAYKIGRGGLSIGKTYLLRVEYPEDKPRFAPIEIQIGQNYIDVGWKNGVSPSNIYDNWPLSGGWQFYDVIIPLGRETTATGGTGDGDATKGFWVYFMDKRKPGFYWSSYSGGPAVATIRLYEIDPITNAPVVNLPAGLPTRVMTFDWERQPTQLPSDIVSYAKLMGYSAVSPIAGMKWNFQNWGDPLAGYDAVNVDDQHYWSTSKYVARSGTPPPMPLPSKPSVHAQYLAATAAAGVDYIPRFEYGGSVDLPVSAQSIGADGKIAKPNRFATYGANLLNRSTYLELKAFFDSFVAPYAASNPQFKGVFWRLRSDRMQISYGAADATLFSNDTGTPLPAGFGTMTAAQVATWCSVTIGAPYTDWWHGKRRDFHQSLITLLKSYRSDLTLVYYNWDIDKFSLKEPDLNSSSFYYQVTTLGGPTAYANDLSARQGYVASNYTSAFNNGDFSGGARTVVRPETNNLWPDYGIRPSLYSSISGIQILAPVNCNCYASFPDYINYFQTHEGLGVSHCVSYDEIAAREPNPKYEGNMITPGGGPFSMAMELLAYYHGDARFLTYTVYTYGRGFADSHRRFAQAFRALPAISGALITGTPTDTAVRVYSGGGNVSYIGIAYKGYSPQSLTILIPGSWQPDYIITDLVLGTSSTVTLAGANLQINLTSGPMELNSFKVSPPPPVNITPPVQRQHL